MLLAVDVGNTNTVVGLYEGHTLKASWRIATNRSRMSDEYAVLLKSLFELEQNASPRHAIISSVVPPVEREMSYALKRYWQLDSMLVSSDLLRSTLSIETDRPYEVGVDQLVNAVAAFDYDAKAYIIIDFGTATTFNLLLQPNRFMGAAIAPGPMTSADALAMKTAKLPRIDLLPPAHAIGTNTIDSMKSGIVLGYASMVDGMVERFAAECPVEYGKPYVIATGGFTRALEGICHTIDLYEPLLTLNGLKQIAERLL